MKPKNVLIAICLIIFCWGLIDEDSGCYAQDVFNFTSVGFSFDEDGQASNHFQTGVAAFLSDSGNVFLVLSPQYGRPIDGDNENGEIYGGKFTYGYVLSSFVLALDVGVVRIETPLGSIGYMNIGASGTLFPWTKMEVLLKERIGLTAGFVYNAGTRQMTGVIAVTTVFGR